MWPYVTKSCPIEHEWKCVKFPWTLLSLSPLRAYFRYEDNILNDYTMRVVQALSCVRLFVTPCHSQTSLSFTISWSLLKLMSIELVMPSNHLVLCHPLHRMGKNKRSWNLPYFLPLLLGRFLHTSWSVSRPLGEQRVEEGYVHSPLWILKVVPGSS